MAGPDFPQDFPDANDDLADVPAPPPEKSEPRRRNPLIQPVGRAFDHVVKAKPSPTTEIERIPPFDLEAEKTLLSMCLVDPGAFAKARGAGLIPGHFFGGTHYVIWGAMLAVEGPLDALTLASHLRQSGTLEQVGGMAGLTELHDNRGYPGHVESYISIVRTRARERDFLFHARRAEALVYTRAGADVVQVAAELRVHIEMLEAETRPSGIQWMEHDALFEPEPATDLLVPKLGIGPGPVNGVFGQGYSGKSISCAFSLGMSVALGKDVWGALSCKPGVWGHLDYEQGRRRTKQVIQRLAAGFGATADDLRGRCRISIFPDVNLTTDGALKHFVSAMEGLTVLTTDALRGMTPGVDENDSIMRGYMQLLSRASEQTGCTVILIHHAGKTGKGGDEERPRKEAGRGSSAIFDECASVLVLSAKKGEWTKATHEKDRELGFLVEDFGLAIEDVPTDDGNPRGGLRVRHLCWEEFQQKQRKEEEQKATFEKTKIAIVDVVKEHPGIGPQALSARLGKKYAGVVGALQELLDEGAIVERGRLPADRQSGKSPRHLYTRGMAPPAPVIAFDRNRKPPETDATDD